MATAHELLKRLRQISKTPREQGELFERFAAAYLRSDKYYGERFSNIWRWNDWPGRGNATDWGIDIVAEERETGALWAIQVKFHESKLDLQDISTFLALSGRKEFQYRMLITSSPLGPRAEEVVRGQEKDVVILTLEDMLGSPIDWETFSWEQPEKLSFVPQRTLRPYQVEAIEAVLQGFERADRGKLIMPPGAGKTFTALQIAERLVGVGGNALFLAPSISLVEQTLRAWLADADVPLRVFAVTSDRTVGRDSESLDRTTVLTIPPTTDAEELVLAVQQPVQDKMTVVVSTYHSIDVVAEAQERGFPAFDLIIADEAHRTTGVMKGSDSEDVSYYHKVHHNDYVRGAKRLYMTATPRVFVPKVKDKLEELGFDYFTMDDVDTYGEEFFRYGFGQAVDDGYLSDYRVIVFTVSEADVQRELLEFLSRDDTPEVEEAARIIGVWNALSGRVQGNIMPPLKRAVVFAGRIAESKAFAEQFARTIEAYHEATEQKDALRRFKVIHVDGSTTATERKELLDWLRDEPAADETRVLTNAKVLTEGIDVPALDAVVFLKPRRSVVDVVQAVGRAMRKPDNNKRYGYVILPVIVDPNRDAAEQLDKNKEFNKVWEILGALRSIDDRFDAMVRELWIQHKRKKKNGEDEQEPGDDVVIVNGEGEQLSFDFRNELFDAILGKLVERVGDRLYLEAWAKDVAVATSRLERHIAEALQHDSDYGKNARVAFEGFLGALRGIINPSVTEDDARSMLVQHIITKPIFDAIFGEYVFLKDNPVSRSFNRVADVFEAFVRKETQALDSFYRLVKVRANGLDKETERQDFLRQLYDTFFKIAFPKAADRLGIVYTPVEVVDFLVQSADAVLQDEFGLSLADEGVVILEPFAGTGTFLSRLMHHIPTDALARKYHKGEIWGNEILLLPYYIALANVESTYYELTERHEPYRNLLLVDSFQLMETEGTMDTELFPEQYTELMRKQQKARINVVVSNPPYSVGQGSENDNNKNLRYRHLDGRVTETYAASSKAVLKKGLYDSYIRAIRWASDRIGDQGVIGFVTNASFIDSTTTDGLRKCLAEEFTSVYCFNTRGNARTSGEQRKKEGGNIFGSGTRAPIAITVLVKNPAKKGSCVIRYHDIGDYLSREQKLERIRQAGSIKNLSWMVIRPNAAHDWINQRNEEFDQFIALGDKGSGGSILFGIFSQGVLTSRDNWTYNFSLSSLQSNMQGMINFYNQQVDGFRALSKMNPTADDVNAFVDTDPCKISWSHNLKEDLRHGKKHQYEGNCIVQAMYRPFCKQWLYFSRAFNERVYQIPKLFPDPSVENRVIAVTGIGASRPFSAMIVDSIPNFHFHDTGQCFPLYYYEETPTDNQASLFEANVGNQENRYIRHDAITDWALEKFRRHYGEKVSKEDIFYYVYGMLHSPEYRERFDAELKKKLPRIPLVASVEDFWVFSRAGRELAHWHLDYETIEPWPTEEKINGDPNDSATYKVEKMRFGKTSDGKEDKTVIVYNEHITLRGIPIEAYEYIVNGKSAIEWILDRYQLRRDKKSGIVNDPNKWLEEQGDSGYIVDLIKRVVRVSMETVRIVKELPGLRLA